MPQFSAFMDFVGFNFSSKPTRGESIYRAMAANVHKAFDLTPGGYEEAKIYATAMGLARARYALERAQNQTDPLTAQELLPQLEKDYGVVPREVDDIVRRQRSLAISFLLAKGAVRQAIEAKLRDILGTDFIALRAFTTFEVTEDETVANFARPDIPFKLIKLLTPVATTGSPVTVDYANADTTAAPINVVKGDVFVFQPDNSGLREVVTITSATATTLTATFTNSHDLGSYATSENWVGWTSTQRTLLVVTASASALDPEKRRLVNEFMAKVCRGVTQWAIVRPTSPGVRTIGPFTLDSSPLDAVPLGTVTVDQPGPLVVTGISPSSGPAAGGITVTASGSGFLAYLELPGLVLFGGTPVTPTIVDDWTLRFTTPAHAVGPVIVTFAVTGEPSATTVYVCV